MSVVPIFAPMTIGMACSKVIEPEATAATAILVEDELLWIMAVISNPINSPTNGLEVASKIDWAVSSPNLENATDIMLMPTKKSRATNMIQIIFFRSKV